MADLSKSTGKVASTPTRAKRGAGAREEFSASERAELRATLSRLRTKRAAPTEAARSRYLRLATDAQCADKGKQTRGHAVARDLVPMLVIIDKVLDAQGGRVAEYSVPRFQYALEWGARLLHELDLTDAERQRVREGRGAVSVAEVEASAGRELLLQKLAAVAGERVEHRAAIAEARGTTQDRASVAASLLSLTQLARKWLGSEEEGDVAADVGLSEALVADVEARRSKLIAEGSNAAIGGAATAHDSPGVNLAEGRCLFEMQAAMTAFANEAARNDQVKRLVPGAATRRALGMASSAKLAEAEGGDGAPAEGGGMPGAGGEGAPATTVRKTSGVKRSVKKRARR